jgi:site-specific recombinase XerD
VYTQLFANGRSVERHLTAPLLDERLRYLTHCADRGAAWRTLRKIAHYQLATMRFLDVQSGKPIRREQIATAADRWVSRQPAHHNQTGSSASRALYLAQATQWLRFLNRFQEPPPPAPPWAACVAEFASYMRQERGLSPVTIYTRCKRVEEFLGWLGRGGRTLRDLSIVQLDEAIQHKGTHDGCTRVSVRTYAYVLRAFLHYAETRRWCSPGLAAVIMPPRVYRSEGLPAGPTWQEVERLCAATAGDSARDIRDRALLLLFAVYGFRASEVRRLRLEDLDWQNELIRIRRSKPQSRLQAYPLLQTVGEEILRYLTTVRPRCGYREVFLSLKAPVHPIGCSALWQIVHRRMQPFDLPVRHQGPHALRHAAATRLLAGGFSLKAIGDYLGHRSAAATGVYAKVDLGGLRRVADFSLEGLR